MVNKLITVLISVVVGLALLPVIDNATDTLTAPAVLDVDGVTVLTPAGQFYDTTIGTLIDLLPILFVIILVAGVVIYVKLNDK